MLAISMDYELGLFQVNNIILINWTKFVNSVIAN